MVSECEKNWCRSVTSAALECAAGLVCPLKLVSSSSPFQGLLLQRWSSSFLLQVALGSFRRPDFSGRPGFWLGKPRMCLTTVTAPMQSAKYSITTSVNTVRSCLSHTLCSVCVKQSSSWERASTDHEEFCWHGESCYLHSTGQAFSISITSVTWGSCDSELLNPILNRCSDTENSELSLALNLEFWKPSFWNELQVLMVATSKHAGLRRREQVWLAQTWQLCGSECVMFVYTWTHVLFALVGHWTCW